jgi:RNA polymerase sigma factor (sigma-70 family)
MQISLEQALHAIRDSDESRSRLIKEIFENSKLRKLILNYVLKNSGDAGDGQTIFNEMIVQLVKTMFAKREIEQDGPLEPYLFSIAKYLWTAELKNRSRFSHTEQFHHDDDDHQPDHERIFLTEERRQILFNLLGKLKTNCRDVLMYWANGFTMEEIAQKLHYLSSGMARKKKSQCFKQLLDYLAENPGIKNQLYHD